MQSSAPREFLARGRGNLCILAGCRCAARLASVSRCTVHPAVVCRVLCVRLRRIARRGARVRPCGVPGLCAETCAAGHAHTSAALRVLDLDGVRVAAAAVDDAAGDDDLVALFELHHLPADLQRVVKQHVGALVHLAHNGRDAP